MTTLENKDIICVAFPSWEGNYVKSTVKLMSELAKRNRVLYVDYQYTYKDVFTTWFGKNEAPVSRMLGFSKRLRKVDTPGGGSLHILTPPPVWSINWMKNSGSYKSGMNRNGNIVRQSILKAARKLNMKNPVVINAFNPFIGLPLAGKLNESALMYYCYDEISECNWCKAHGKKIEEEFIKKVDAVITTSDGLYEQKRQLTSNCFVVKNGVDFSLFNKAADTKQKTRNSEITVGYIGSMDERLDYDLLIYLAENLPEVKFHYVGRIVNEAKVKALDKFLDVRVYGAKKVEELPQFLRHFDVALIPFVKTRQTANIYPMKINEYLAAGVPVVATDFAPLEEFGSHISVAADKESFLKAVQKCLNEDTLEKRQQRIDWAREHSWEKRGEQFEQILDQLVMEKKGVLTTA